MLQLEPISSVSHHHGDEVAMGMLRWKQLYVIPRVDQALPTLHAWGTRVDPWMGEVGEGTFTIGPTSA